MTEHKEKTTCRQCLGKGYDECVDLTHGTITSVSSPEETIYSDMTDEEFKEALGKGLIIMTEHKEKCEKCGEVGGFNSACRYCLQLSPESKGIEEFIEAGADLEHDRWAKWQKYLHSLCTVELKDGTFEETGRLIIEADRVNHWNRQIETPYSQLTEKEKEYDRVEVRKYLPLIENLLASARQEADQRVAEAVRGERERIKQGILSLHQTQSSRHDWSVNVENVIDFLSAKIK